MGKRSNFEKIDKDKYYTTDPKAVVSLKKYLPDGTSYYEPCVGKGDLVNLLLPFRCMGASDEEKDARTFKYETSASYFISNPPWSRDLLHPIIDNLRSQLLTWLLFDADWMHTVQAAPYLKYCKVILSVGRLKWFPDSNNTGKDNVCWYLFGNTETETKFVSR